MIAKFHSAPGHSMETTLRFNLPPKQEIRMIKEKEKAREGAPNDKDAKAEERREKRQRKKEEQERAKHQDADSERQGENDSRDSQVREQGSSRVHTERAGSYKDKFQRMREKYDKVTAAHETSQRDLELLNAKLKKLQSENDLLLDAMLASETDLYERYFDRSASSSPVPDPTLPTPPSQISRTQSQAPTPRSTHYRELPPPQSGISTSIAGSMAPPSSGVSSASTGGAPGSAGLRQMPPPFPPVPPSASSNGTSVSNGTNAMPPPSSTTSSNGTTGTPPHGRRAMWNSQASPFMSGTPRSRRRSSGAEPGSVPLAPEEVTTNGDAARPDLRTSIPVVSDTQQEGNESARPPRMNGNSSPVVNGNGLNSRIHRNPSRETTPVREPIHERREAPAGEGHFMELDVDDDVGPASPGPEAGAGVHSPIDGEEESDEESRGMDVDDEPRSPGDLSRRGAAFGSLMRGGRA